MGLPEGQIWNANPGRSMSGGIQDEVQISPLTDRVSTFIENNLAKLVCHILCLLISLVKDLCTRFDLQQVSNPCTICLFIQITV